MNCRLMIGLFMDVVQILLLLAILVIGYKEVRKK